MACLLALVLVAPILFVIGIGFQFGWDAVLPLVFRPLAGELLLNTLLLVAIATPLCVVLGVGGAWLVERTDLPGRRIWAVLLAAPLAVPAFVSSYGWASAVPSIGGLGGGVLIAVLAYYPLVYLPAAAAIRSLDGDLEDSARALGLDGTAVFFRVLVPQLRLAVTGGALIVALHLLSEYGAFAMIRFDTFTTAIMVQYQSTFTGPAAGALGLVLALVCLVLLVLESGARGRARYARVGSGVARSPELTRLRRWRPVAVLAPAALTVLAVGVPLATVLRWLFVGWFVTGEPVLQRHLLEALAATAGLGVAAAAVTAAVAVPFAWLAVRYPSRMSRVLEGSAYVASSLPAIIVALAIVTISIRLVPWLYQSTFTAVLAYVIVFTPRALVSIRSGVARAPIALEEAARSLGRPPWLARLTVTLPLIAPSLLAGAALVALGVANELTATLLLSPSGTRTLATEFWSASSSIEYTKAAPYAVLLILCSVPAVWLLFAQSRGVVGRRSRSPKETP